ncbi:cupin domain-containing protein [Streptomyces roseoverticillatus]|uniref:Cupin domain-containing protein n=1 Tax=Streptomyces roseoverticillatus TaxID=66429 RepID=A0ABV3ILS4_9ACTN
MTADFETSRIADAVEVTAPDGATVRPLCSLPGTASSAQFALAPRQVSKAVSHVSVEEIWFITTGSGEMWRRQYGREEITVLEPGVCLTIPLGTTFQFRAGPDGLCAVAVTIPPWPDGDPDEARSEAGRW